MNQKKVNNRTLGEALTLPLGLENNRKLRFFRSLTFACCGLVLAIVVWSAIAEVREVAVARGQIVPSNAVQKVHHLEGGILASVLVAEGQAVNEGQPMLRLRPEGAGSDLDQLETRLISLRMQHSRLQALLTGGKPDFTVFGNLSPEIQKDQLAFYSNTLNNDARDREKLDLELHHTETELSTMSSQQDSLARQVATESEKMKIRQKSFDMGYTSKIVFLEARARFEDVQSRLASAEGKVSDLGGKVKEAQHSLLRAEAGRTQKLAEESSKVTTELFETQNAIKKYRDRVARLTVRSPAKGIVQLLPVQNAGEVIKPGDLVAEVISVHADVIAEVHLQAKDVGHVKIGDPARIKASNYDPTGIEIATGRVVDISATTFETKEGEPYYRTRIKLDSAYVGPPDRNWRLIPGMVVEADIVTGSKSVMKYMLNPVFRSLDTAFAER
jgi:adhesin transport system membrane fusion protein